MLTDYKPRRTQHRVLLNSLDECRKIDMTESDENKNSSKDEIKKSRIRQRKLKEAANSFSLKVVSEILNK